MPHIPPDQCSPDDAAFAPDVWLSHDDLRHAGIVDSWKTLGECQRDFPRGRLFAPQHPPLEHAARN
jgi:hypothetical protein